MTDNRMLGALARQRGLRLVDDVEAVIGMGSTVRLDAGWQNPVTGLGTSRDKTTYNQYGGAPILTEGQLSELYHGDDLAARMVDIVPDEMLREGFQLELGDAGLAHDVMEQCEALGMSEKLADGIRWGRLFGGGGLIIGADDGKSAATQLEPEKAKALSYLYTFDRRYLWPLTFYRTAGHPKLGQPETYMVMSPASRSDIPVAVVHETRLIIFGGATTGLREREVNGCWDYSVLQRPNEVLGNFNLGWNAVSVLLQDGNQAVFKMSGLAAAIAEGQSEAITARMREMDRSRSIIRAIVVDAGDGTPEGPAESYERQVFPMTGIPDTLDKMMLRLAAAVQIPVTILMGQSPAGMNATGDSDFRWFYDRIRSQQTRVLAPRIRRLVDVLLATRAIKAGRRSNRLHLVQSAAPYAVKFSPLWTEPPLQAAQTRLALIQGDALLADKAILPPQAIALARQVEGGYEREIPLTPALKRALEALLKDDIGGGDGGMGGIELAPTDLAKIVKVNEARKQKGLPPVENGELTIEAYNALQTSATTAIGTDQPTTAANVKGAEEVVKPPPPAPFGGAPDEPEPPDEKEPPQ